MDESDLDNTEAEELKVLNVFVKAKREITIVCIYLPSKPQEPLQGEAVTLDKNQTVHYYL